MFVVIVGAVVVIGLVLLCLELADRHDARRGHRPQRMGDIRSATRQQRGNLRVARSARRLPRVPGDRQRPPARPKQQND